jgi:thioredoxin-dependent peroxiredoxin
MRELEEGRAAKIHRGTQALFRDRDRLESLGIHGLSTDYGASTMGDWIEEGERAPAFSLTADDGKKVRLADFKGRPVVLYFYPKDDTPGCTREACAFRDQQAPLKKLGAVVLGVSADGVESHGEFRDKYDLNFPLLADPDHKMAEKYGAWREKNMYGKKFMGIQRSTFLIDADGKVAKLWKAVKVDGHDEQVLRALAGLS